MDIKIKELPMIWGGPKDAPYKMVQGNRAKWFYKPGPFAADDGIFMDGGKGSNGFGGRTITFQIDDGTTYDSIGPWRAGADAMLEDTGVDIRNSYGSRLVLSRGIKSDGHYGSVYLDVVYHEEHKVEGLFERAYELAKQKVKEMNEPLFYYIETAGGTQSGKMKPEDK